VGLEVELEVELGRKVLELEMDLMVTACSLH
jgi:hypothetical protein